MLYIIYFIILFVINNANCVATDCMAVSALDLKHTRLNLLMPSIKSSQSIKPDIDNIFLESIFQVNTSLSPDLSLNERKNENYKLPDFHTLKEELGKDWWDPRNINKFHNEKLVDLFKEYNSQSLLSEKQIFEANMNFRSVQLIEKKEETLNHLNRLLENSAKIGHPGAQYKLAMQIGIKDTTQSKRLIHTSAAQGYAKALYELSIAYLSIPELFDLKPDSKISYELCKEAEERGDPQAKYRLVSAPLFGTYGEKKDKSIVIADIKNLANEGNSLAKEFVEDIQDMDEEDLDEIINN